MRMSLSIFDNLWQFEQKSDFSIGNNLFCQLSDVTDQQSCFYSNATPATLTYRQFSGPVMLKVLLDYPRTFQGHKHYNTYFKSSFQICKSQYKFLVEVMCVGFQLLYDWINY